MTRWVWPSLAATAAALCLSFYVYTYRLDLLPDKVPTHWGINGQPDAWVPRDNILVNFLMVPGFMLLMIGLIFLLPWLSPQAFKVDRFRDTFNYLMFLVVLLFGYIHAIILVGSLKDVNLDIGRVLVAGIFLFFALIGNVLGKVRRNFWMGVRTPWTLASETVWNRTHRVAAWLWTVAGLIGFVGVLAGVPMWIAFVFLMVVALAPVLHSLLLYKSLERQGKLEPVGAENGPAQEQDALS